MSIQLSKLATEYIHKDYRRLYDINYKILAELPYENGKFRDFMRKETEHISIENFLEQGDWPVDPYDDYQKPSRLLRILCDVDSMPETIRRALETRIKWMVLAAYVVTYMK